MLANWIHIVIVHLAVIGVPYLLYRSIAQRKEALDSRAWKGIFSLLIILGGIAATAYFTGPRAADYTKEILNEYPQDLVENHGLWGRIGFVIQIIAALIGVMGWASILQEEKPDRRLPWVVMILMALNTLVLLYTAHLGGMIRRGDLVF